jgi:flagellar hook-basal body protein
VEFTGNLDAAQQATDSGGVLDLGTLMKPTLPIAINLGIFGPVWATDSTRLTYTTLPNGDFAFQQVAGLSTTMAYPITNGMIDIGLARTLGGNYAWEQVPPIPPTSTATSVVYDSTGAQREISVLFYQVNDLGDGGVNPSSGPNQAVYAWYAFETTGGIQPQTDHLLGGTGIIEGDCQPTTGQWYYDRGRSGDLYAGDFIWFNTDGSLASTGGSGGPNPTPPGNPNYMTIPRVYIPSTNVYPPISPLPTQGADTLAIDLDFGTGGLLGDGKRDGLYSDAAGSYETMNGISQYVPASTACASSQDGYHEGRLESLNWDSRGVLNGEFSNGQSIALARLGLARVANPEGLASVGGNAFVQTANSGDLYSGTAGQNGLGVVRGGNLETSNVDLATELVNMIIAQRGFEANAQVLKVADEMERVRVHLGE